MTRVDFAAIASACFAVDARVTFLDGEVDENARLDLVDGTRLLLKLHREGAADLHLQDAVLRHLESVGEDAPRLLGSALWNGRTARLLTWIEGEVWAAADRSSPMLLCDLGMRVARLDRALRSFEHAALDRPYRWNMRRAAVLAAEGRAGLPRTDATTAWAVGQLDWFVTEILPSLDALPSQAIHNDANENNVLVSQARDGTEHVSGIIDVGDVVRGPRIVGLAVATLYAMLHRPEPLRAALDVVRGYHRAWPLEPDELLLLDGLIRTRAAMSIVNAALQSHQQPSNADYLTVSQQPMRAVVERLRVLEPAFAHFSFRDACGLRPVPHAHAIAAFLRSRECGPAPILDADLAAAPVLDWSVGGSRAASLDKVPSIGRYREERAVYTTDAFATDASDGERRTVHMGIDVFVPAGSAVYAPFDAVVRAGEHRADEGDYGGVVMLEHGTSDGVPFWLLIGHLSKVSATALVPGTRIERGTQVATVGERAENGGWPPHVHVQLYTDLLGRSTDLPGVVRRSQLDVWESISPNPAPVIAGLVEGRVEAPRTRTSSELVGRRAANLSAALSLSYRDPLMIVGGQGASLVDADGRSWIDLVNNVCHVGHAHPRVVSALSDQAATLNTNTRYLHPTIVEYARRLLDLFPDPLSVVFLTNSGSEANDLALRIARTATGRTHVLAIDWAYHGNLTSLIDVSAYKFKRRGGAGPGRDVHICELPDPYRGRFGNDGAAYVSSIEEHVVALRREQDGPAAFIHESIPGCAGQVELAQGYLAPAYDIVRSAGGLCIADEVQCGLGRVGDAMWAFEAHGVVPDIVTLGKPIGNGHPLGAVVTTSAAARGFANGMEYFNTFGGNPVSCAVGLAVLDVVRDEGLVAHASVVGGRLAAGLRDLARRHPMIGDVRGRGLFLGVDLVLDRDTRAPATEAAAAVVEAMKRRGVLLSSDGPNDNVLKVKPPMVLTVDQVDIVLRAFDDSMLEVGA